MSRSVTYTFSNDPPDTNPIDADEVNRNFSDIEGWDEDQDDSIAGHESRIDALELRQNVKVAFGTTSTTSGGDGSFGPLTVAHGLATTPNHVSVTATGGIQYEPRVSWDATNVYISGNTVGGGVGVSFSVMAVKVVT
jgi:hypothetical protein